MILLTTGLMARESLFVSCKDTGIGVYNGLFHSTAITHSFDLFVYIIGAIILLLTAFYPRQLIKTLERKRSMDISFALAFSSSFYEIWRYDGASQQRSLTLVLPLPLPLPPSSLFASLSLPLSLSASAFLSRVWVYLGLFSRSAWSPDSVFGRGFASSKSRGKSSEGGGPNSLSFVRRAVFLFRKKCLLLFFIRALREVHIKKLGTRRLSPGAGRRAPPR